MSAEVEEMLKRFQTCKNVSGIIVVNSEGIPIKYTLEYTLALQYAGLMQALNEKAKQVVGDLDASNDFIHIRLRTLKHEVIVAPADDYFIIVLQDPSD